MKEPGYVVLYNPISNEGHLDSWHVLFVRLLLAAGQPVIAMTTDPEGIVRKLAAQGIRPGQNLLIVRTAWATSSVSDRRLVARLRGIWVDQNAHWHALRFQRNWRLREPDRLAGRIAAWLHIHTSFCLAGAAKLLHKGYRRARGRAKNATRPAPYLLSPNEFRDQVNAVIASHPGQIACVLNMYIDAYRTDAHSWREFGFDEGVPWSALYITAPDEPTHAYCALASCCGTLLLDEAIAARYRTTLPGKRVAYLPDIADTSLPESPSPLSLRIARAAAGRKIVFMGGSIGKQKNLERWYELIARADPHKWFFVQIGRINWHNLTPRDAAALEQTVKSLPANLYIEPTYLPDERSFNEIIAMSAVIFAVYRDFFRSSNMLSKAAYFEKPILVASDCLMGDRVRRYGIGMAVGPDDTLAMVEALEKIEGIEGLKSSFQRYRDEISEAVMQQTLTSFLKQCIAN